MALEASHIRLALDLKGKYRISELDKYLSGTIYPDSRYITKIKRSQTHPADYLTWDLDQIDDFKKGWFVHLLCDKTQRIVMEGLVPSASEGSVGQGGEVWIKHTALKILQDLDDVKKFDVQHYLPCLNYVENPNEEDLFTLRRYNDIFLKMYAEPKSVTSESCYWMWKEFGVENELLEKIKQQVEEYARDADVMTKIGTAYDKTLSLLKDS